MSTSTGHSWTWGQMFGVSATAVPIFLSLIKQLHYYLAKLRDLPPPCPKSPRLVPLHGDLSRIPLLVLPPSLSRDEEYVEDAYDTDDSDCAEDKKNHS